MENSKDSNNANKLVIFAGVVVLIIILALLLRQPIADIFNPSSSSTAGQDVEGVKSKTITEYISEIKEGKTTSLTPRIEVLGDIIYEDYSTTTLPETGEVIVEDLWVNTTGDTMTGNLTITENGTLILPSIEDLLFHSSTLKDKASATESGAYLIGAYDEFANSNSTNVQAVLNDLDDAISDAQAGISSISETDPIFSNSPAASITNTLISYWNKAYSWGDHSIVGYITSESDPVWTIAEPSYFNRTQNETITGIPNFNGGVSGSTAPFTVDSNYVISSLNADLLDGFHASDFMGGGIDLWVDEAGDTMLGNLIMSGADINIGINNLITGANTISSIEIDILDSGINFSELTGSLGDLQISAGAVDLDSSEIAGILPISYGGTNASTFTINEFLWFDGTRLIASGYDQNDFISAITDNWVDDTGDTITGSLLFSGVASDITTGTDEHLALMPNGTGNVGIGTTSPTQQLEITESFELPNTTSATTGVIYKDSDPFIHNFRAAGTDGNNVFIGINSGNFTMSSTTFPIEASNNTGVGYNTLNALTSGYGNSAFGVGSLTLNSSGSSNSAFGVGALGGNTTGYVNTAMGVGALYMNTSGTNNNAFGVDSLWQNTTGLQNNAFGNDALSVNTTGDDNAAFGEHVLYYNNTGNRNSAFGNWALEYVTNGNNNAAFGYGALGEIGSNSSGNTAIGYQAGFGSFSFSNSNNSLVGYGAGYNLSTGSNNVLIGYQAGDNLVNGNNNIIMGYDLNAPSASGSNQMYLGGVIYGDLSTGNIGIGTTAPGQELEVNGDIRLDANEAATTNGLCHSGAASDTTFADRDIVACSAAPGDIAEWYETKDGRAGDIVMTTGETITYSSPAVNAETGVILNKNDLLTASILTKTDKPYQPTVLGVISTSPYETFGKGIKKEAINENPVALTGRVPVKVTTTNGSIKPGDPITTSSIPGVGMKSTKPGPVIGLALDYYNDLDPNKIGKILVAINLSWYEPEDYLNKIDSIISDYGSGLLGRSGNLDSVTNFTITQTLTANQGTFSSITVNNLLVNNSLTVNGLITSKNIKTEILKAYSTKNIIVKLSESIGDTAFIIQNNLNENVFSVDSNGKINLKEDKLSPSIGEGIIPKGSDYVRIYTDSVTRSSRIFITPTVETDKQLSVIEKAAKDYFVVKISYPVDYNISFDWWIVN
ncbi:MAG: hypothetical protein ABIE03_04160 [Patescibacteria group bacterium]|nr:hypothetical protein [Patescibacteria group bacterium]